MYKIMIHIDTHTNDTWFYYQEEGKDYVADSLEEIRETVLTLIDVYGEDYIKIVKQETGDDMNGSVETFLYDSTDNYEELVNRPFINGVEIVGALSLAELGIQPVGNYATNERVDALEETVNNIDFSPYATNARVDQVEYKVDNIDLTPYATNERVDQVEAKVDAIDLEPYATMDYLDEVVAGIDFSASNENITGVKTFSVLPRSTVMPVTEDELTNKSYVDHEVLGCATEAYVDDSITTLSNYVDEQLANAGGKSAIYQINTEKYLSVPATHKNESLLATIGEAFTKYFNGETGIPTFRITASDPMCLNPDYIFELHLLNGLSATYYATKINRVYSSDAPQLYIVRMTFTLTETDGVYSTNSVDLSYTSQGEKILTAANKESYTPTSYYHPATKKYVDDSIAGIEIPEINLDEYATTEYVDNAIASIDIPESGGSGGAIDFGDTPVYIVSTKSGTNMTTEHVVLDDYNAPDYGTALRKAISSGAKTFIISIFFTGHGMSLDLRYTINDDGSIFVLKLREPFKVSIGSYIIGYSPVIENMVTNISSIETATMYLRVQHMNQSALCPIEKNTATKSYVDNAIANAITAVLEGEY